MRNSLKTRLVFFLLTISAVTLSAQYQQSGGLLTIDDGSLIYTQHNSVGAQSGNRNYAVSHQYTYYNGSACWRKLRYFDGSGNFLASSGAYSHDHGGGTKILFDPKDDNVVYALYQERASTTVTPPEWRTYVKRMELQSGVVLEGQRVEVFNHNNSVDLEVISNQGVTDLIVTGVMDNGSVQVKIVREFTTTLISFRRWSSLEMEVLTSILQEIRGYGHWTPI